MKRIAVEDSLSPISRLLQQRGFETVPLDRSRLDGIDAVVLSGQDDDLMGIENILTEAPVINAEGLTPEDVVARIEREV